MKPTPFLPAVPSVGAVASVPEKPAAPPCGECNGKGKVWRAHQLLLTGREWWEPCPSCQKGANP